MGFLSLYVKVKMEFNQTEKFILHHIQVARELKKKIGVENDE